MANMNFKSGFTKGEKVIWLAPNTRSMLAIFEGYREMINGESWAKITIIPGLSGGKPFKMEVPAEQLVCNF